MDSLMNGNWSWKDGLTDWKSMGSMYATLTLLRGAVRDLVPPEVHQLAKRSYSYVFSKVQTKFLTIRIQQYENNYENTIFKAVECYLGTKCYTSSSELVRLSKIKNAKNHTYTMAPKQVIQDIFNGIKFSWTLLENEQSKQFSDRGYFLEVTFESKYKEVVNSTYLPHITKEAEIFAFHNRGKKLYTNRRGDSWAQVCLFSHPSTFDTIALAPCLKKEIQEDLKKFVSRSEFYTRVGKAWKRGYLLYGPPGTGKTSLIAAIANYLEFDIYDMELTSVRRNEDLRELLINTSSKSIIVVEDIDCSIHIENRKKKSKRRKNNDSSVSLSGVLNFVDGLWSPCAGERLIIFTTNHKEKLDPALLRSGRMDKHILLSYCNMESFKVLAKNYLKLEEHELMKEVEELLGLLEITPADVAECLMSYDEDPDMGMRNVVEQLKKRLHSKNNENKEKDTKKKSRSDTKEKQKAKKKKERKKKREDSDESVNSESSDESESADESKSSDESDYSDESDQSDSSDDSDNSGDSTGSDESDGYETAESDNESNEFYFTDEMTMAINMLMI